jgi:hypothetical protein
MRAGAISEGFICKDKKKFGAEKMITLRNYTGKLN